MSEQKPFDPFSSLDLNTFKNNSQPKPKPLPEKNLIREVAQESKFQSRQPVLKKPKHIPKTFSLFPDDTIIIKNGLRFYMDQNNSNQPSGSDVVRAALHIFAKKSPEEQARLIEQYRARGKRG
jgi:hypothetical protein